MRERDAALRPPLPPPPPPPPPPAELLDEGAGAADELVPPWTQHWAFSLITFENDGENGCANLDRLVAGTDFTLEGPAGTAFARVQTGAAAAADGAALGYAALDVGGAGAIAGDAEAAAGCGGHTGAGPLWGGARCALELKRAAAGVVREGQRRE